MPKIDGSVWALGAMSGTSLDGVDAAMLRTDGLRIFEFGAAHYLERDAAKRGVVAAALGKWPGEEGVKAAAAVVEAEHIWLLSRFEGAAIIGFHGQTLAHQPDLGRTHQAGDGAALAKALNLPVVWDFRTADMAMGGQGAPLAPFYHFACAKWIGAVEPLAFLNLGGVGNLTWIDPSKDRPEQVGALLAFDTGPANAPLDDLIRQRTGAARDENGTLARAGRADAALLKAALARPYMFQVPPKSLDRNDFHDLLSWVRDLSLEDAAATLVAVAAGAVAHAMTHCPARPGRVLVTGGGRRNSALMRALQERLDCPVEPVEAAGLDGDMLEAQAFAFLAVRVARGLPTSCPSTTGVRTALGGGVISHPG